MPYRAKLFAGIDLDPHTRAQCAQVATRLEAHGLNARFEAPEKLHITLAFLGWVQAEQVEPVREILRVTAARTRPFRITLDKIGAFPNERNPHVVWIGARDQGAAFQELSHEICDAYARIGFRFEKDAVAHVTIARIKEHRQHLSLLEFPPMHLDVHRLTLFESLPDGRTTRYEVRDRASLSSISS